MGYTAMTRHKETARFYTVSPGSTERELEPENSITEGEKALDASRAKLLAIDQADPGLDNATLRAALTTPPPVVTKRIGDRPSGVLDRDQWTRAASTLLRDPDLDLARTPDLAGPAGESGWTSVCDPRRGDGTRTGRRQVRAAALAVAARLSHR